MATISKIAPLPTFHSRFHVVQDCFQTEIAETSGSGTADRTRQGGRNTGFSRYLVAFWPVRPDARLIRVSPGERAIRIPSGQSRMGPEIQD
jgi:hypothetical protein